MVLMYSSQVCSISFAVSGSSISITKPAWMITLSSSFTSGVRVTSMVFSTPMDSATALLPSIFVMVIGIARHMMVLLLLTYSRQLLFYKQRQHTVSTHPGGYIGASGILIGYLADNCGVFPLGNIFHLFHDCRGI